MSTQEKGKREQTPAGGREGSFHLQPGSRPSLGGGQWGAGGQGWRAESQPHPFPMQASSPKQAQLEQGGDRDVRVWSFDGCLGLDVGIRN